MVIMEVVNPVMGVRLKRLVAAVILAQIVNVRELKVR
jgi:hypothetical protein